MGLLKKTTPLVLVAPEDESHARIFLNLLASLDVQPRVFTKVVWVAVEPPLLQSNNDAELPVPSSSLRSPVNQEDGNASTSSSLSAASHSSTSDPRKSLTAAHERANGRESVIQQVSSDCRITVDSVLRRVTISGGSEADDFVPFQLCLYSGFSILTSDAGDGEAMVNAEHELVNPEVSSTSARLDISTTLSPELVSKLIQTTLATCTTAKGVEEALVNDLEDALHLEARKATVRARERSQRRSVSVSRSSTPELAIQPTRPVVNASGVPRSEQQKIRPAANSEPAAAESPAPVSAGCASIKTPATTSVTANQLALASGALACLAVAVYAFRRRTSS